MCQVMFPGAGSILAGRSSAPVGSSRLQSTMPPLPLSSTHAGTDGFEECSSYFGRVMHPFALFESRY